MIPLPNLLRMVRMHHPHSPTGLLEDAYHFAQIAHEGQFRSSGEPYFSHPTTVALILASFKMDVETLAAGLLHDVLEDTPTTYEELEERFGRSVAHMVQGVTMITRDSNDKVSFKNEGFRRFFLAIMEDDRVLMVKLADRLHNMRTLQYVSNPQKRRAKALETMELYAPLAYRIGFYPIYEELCDLSLQHLETERYQEIQTKLNELHTNAQSTINKTFSQLHRALLEAGISVQITGRIKSVYSIWRKMQYYRIRFDRLSDIIGFRIIVSTIEECYRVMDILFEKFPVKEKIVKDFIKTPKKNNYRSLHLAIRFEEFQQDIEVQIRTEEMHQEAEFGQANHFYYKQRYLFFEWVKKNIELVSNPDTSPYFLERIKFDLGNRKIFCFTPKGQVVVLPYSSTCLDFAFSIHRDLGKRARGAMVNGVPVSLRALIKNGDEVSILTEEDQIHSAVQPLYLEKFVQIRTLRNFLLHHSIATITQGRKIFRAYLRQNKITWNQKTIRMVCALLGLEDLNSLYIKVAEDPDFLHRDWLLQYQRVQQDVSLLD